HIWKPNLLLSGALIVLTYAVLLGFMMLIGVLTRSSSITMMLTYFLFPMSAVLSQHKNITAMLTNQLSIWTIEGLYGLVPKIAEIGKIIASITHGTPVDSLAPIASSALVGALCLAGAVLYFQRKDY